MVRLIKKLDKKRLLNRLLGSLVVYIVAMGFVLVTTNIIKLAKEEYYLDKDATYWIEYESIEPMKKVFHKDETLVFRSTIHLNNTAHLFWNDVLRCDTDGSGNFVFRQSYLSNYNAIVDIPSKVVSIWSYGGAAYVAPKSAESACFLDSQTMVCPPELEKAKNSCKVFTEQTDIFYIVE
jgi:hypothetical protein